MKRLIYSAALAFYLSAVLIGRATAQSNSVYVSTDALAYSVHVSSLKALNFGNLKYHLGGEWIQLRDGRYRHRDRPFGGVDADVQNVWLFDVSNEQPQHALVSIDLTHFGGSSSPDGYVLLFEIRGGALVQSAEFKYDAQAPGTGAKFDRSELTIVARTNENTPNCCAKHVDEETFAWISGKFQQVRYRVMPVVDPQARKSP